MLRAVVDTNILFEGLTKVGAAGTVIDHWVARRFLPCVSTALALEYEEVLTNKLSAGKRERALTALPALLNRAEFVPIPYRLRPLSPDPDDDFLIECAFHANAVIVSANLRDLLMPSRSVGVTVHTAERLLLLLKES